MRYDGPTNGIVALSDAGTVMDADIIPIMPGALMIYINSVTIGESHYFRENLYSDVGKLTSNASHQDFWKKLLHSSVHQSINGDPLPSGFIRDDCGDDADGVGAGVIFHRFLYKDKIVRVLDDFMKNTDFCYAYASPA